MDMGNRFKCFPLDEVTYEKLNPDHGNIQEAYAELPIPLGKETVKLLQELGYEASGQAVFAYDMYCYVVINFSLPGEKLEHRINIFSSHIRVDGDQCYKTTPSALLDEGKWVDETYKCFILEPIMSMLIDLQKEEK